MKCIIGYLAIDVDGGALNNAGAEPGAATDNTVAVKKIKTRQGYYPYVSAQALRYWWRNTLIEKFNWNMSPITRDKKIARTEADPIQYPDDDVFGYMSAKKIEIEEKGKTKMKDMTVTRASPLKTSILVSVSPVSIVNDFGTMSRHEGDAVPFEHQFYKAILKGIFSLNIDEVSKFSSIERSGFQNIREEQIPAIKETYKDITINETSKIISLKSDIKKQRITETIDVLPYLFGGAKSTLHLTDVAPSLLILALFNGGNHILSNALYDDMGTVKINYEGLKQLIQDFSSDLLSKIYIGIKSGFIQSIEEITAEIKKIDIESKLFVIDSPKAATMKFLEEIDDKIA